MHLADPTEDGISIALEDVWQYSLPLVVLVVAAPVALQG